MASGCHPRASATAAWPSAAPRASQPQLRASSASASRPSGSSSTMSSRGATPPRYPGLPEVTGRAVPVPSGSTSGRSGTRSSVSSIPSCFAYSKIRSSR